MGYALAPDIHLCVPASGPAIFLDLARDCYVGTSARVSTKLRERIACPATERAGALDPLEAAGLLVFADMRDEFAIVPDRRCTLSEPPPPGVCAASGVRPALRDAAAIAVLTCRLAWRLRRGLPHALAPPRKASNPSMDAADCAAPLALATRYRLARRYLPFRPQCLLDSLVFHHWAKRHGLSARLVIGVRPTPFAAHCWVEHDGTPLNDDWDAVAPFQTIYAQC